ncbi:uncharacterized protein LOC129594638 [Paramacrobiotus metropolitanus]|uniref:uncharacterized protein LOC129594638 n=1 Tax=Paramacrobiotus metropolitanus TaxID=2943436 RepID=UPI0024460917|nr:uncharacterized protein LOC129594638 [Paramacrobiotus metropolitanus]
MPHVRNLLSVAGNKRLDEKNVANNPVSNSTFENYCRGILFLLRLGGLCPWCRTETGTKIVRYSVFCRIVLFMLTITCLIGDLLTYIHSMLTTTEPKIPLTLIAGLFVLYELVIIICGWLMAVHSRLLPTVIAEIGQQVRDAPVIASALKRYITMFIIFFGGSSIIYFFIVARRIIDAWHQKEVIFGYEFWSVYAVSFELVALIGNSCVALAFMISFVLLALTLAMAFKQTERQCTYLHRAYHTEQIDYKIFATGINKCRQEHLTLSCLVQQLDDIYAPANLVSLAAEIGGSVLFVGALFGVAPSKVGYIFTNNTTGVFFSSFIAFCNLTMLMQRTFAAAYMHCKAHSITLVLNSISEKLNSDNDGLEGQINKTLRRLRDCPVALTAGSIFTLNTEFILSVPIACQL